MSLFKSTRAKVFWTVVGFAVLDAPQWLDAVVDLAERPSTKPYFDRLLAISSRLPSMNSIALIWSLRGIGLTVLVLVGRAAIRDHRPVTGLFPRRDTALIDDGLAVGTHRGAPRITCNVSRGRPGHLQLTVTNIDPDGRDFYAKAQIAHSVESDRQHPTEWYSVPWTCGASIKGIRIHDSEDLLVCEWSTREEYDYRQNKHVRVADIELATTTRNRQGRAVFHRLTIPEGDMSKGGEMVLLNLNVFCDNNFEQPFKLEGNIHFQTGDNSPTLQFNES